MRQAIAGLGYTAPRDDVDAIFAELDADQSGAIEYNELNSALRRSAELAPELRAGAVGPIELTAKNRSSKGLPLATRRPQATKPLPRAVAHAVAYAAAASAALKQAAALRNAPPRPLSARPCTRDRGIVTIGARDPKWLNSAAGPRPHSAPPSLGVTARHTLEVDIEHCVMGDPVEEGREESAAATEYRDRAEAVAALLEAEACVGSGKLVVICNRGASDGAAEKKPFAPGVHPCTPCHDGTNCCTGIHGPPFPSCPRCCRPRFGCAEYPRPGSFEISLTLVHQPPAPEMEDDDMMDETCFMRLATPRSVKYGPVRLTSRLASHQWPSEATLTKRFREQVAVLLATRAGAAPDHWPYHPTRKTLFAHVKNLPTLRGQATELSPRNGTIATPRHREAPKPAMPAGKPIPARKGAAGPPPVAPRPPPSRPRSDRFIRKGDPGVRDMRDATWEWTRAEADGYFECVKAGSELQLEEWMGKAALNQCRTLYDFSVAEAMRGALKFRPRRADDVLNGNLPLASAAGIVATAPRSLRPS